MAFRDIVVVSLAHFAALQRKSLKVHLTDEITKSAPNIL
jgi:hypothetical protein